MRYHFTDTERDQLAASFVLLWDTREQENGHILAWLDVHRIKHRQRSLATGDYGIMLPACPELGLHRDIYFNAAVERKNGVDELVATVKDRTRFENELIRGSRLGFFAVVVEDADGYERMAAGDYRSEYKPKALLASVAALSARYSVPFVYVAQNYVALWLWLALYYFALEELKKGGGG